MISVMERYRLLVHNVSPNPYQPASVPKVSPPIPPSALVLRKPSGPYSLSSAPAGERAPFPFRPNFSTLSKG